MTDTERNQTNTIRDQSHTNSWSHVQCAWTPRVCRNSLLLPPSESARNNHDKIWLTVLQSI